MMVAASLVMLLSLATGAQGDARAHSRASPDLARLFSRAEPHLAAGHAALTAGDADAALTAFRAATADAPDERAMVEYDVGQALVVQAQADAAAAPKAEGGATKVDVSSARASFDRAFGLALAPSLKSEAALASGNAAALGGDIDAAIAQYRKALVADVANERAKKNLRRALDAKRAQPPPKDPPKDGDSDPKDDKKDGDKPKDDKADKKDGDKPKDDDKPQDKPDDAKKPGEPAKPQPAPGDDQQPQAPKDAKAQKKEDAKRLLDALGSREKPLSPLQMRGAAPERAKDGKDW